MKTIFPKENKQNLSFFLAQLEVDIIKTLERSDLLRFYDHYISPNSISRRKLSVHVNPSSLVQVDEINAVEIDDELAGITEEELAATVVEAIPVTGEINHETIKLTEQPSIVDSLTEINLNEPDKVLPKKELNLPKVCLLIIRFLFYFIFDFSRRNGSIMFIYGKVTCHVIH